jgi:hypothetical protein
VSDSRPEHARRLIRAFEGEVFGESFFTEMARHRTDQHEADVLITLATLERHMGFALAALLDDWDVEAPDPGQSRRRGVESAERLANQSWNEFLSEFATGTSRALAGYERLRAAAPEPDHPTLVLLSEHEIALRDFAEIAQQGTADPLAPVRKMIQGLSSHRSVGAATRCAGANVLAGALHDLGIARSPPRHERPRWCRALLGSRAPRQLRERHAHRHRSQAPIGTGYLVGRFYRTRFSAAP